MPCKPLISVILPVYKVKINYLQECIESVINQIYKNWELCITDDFSQDEKIHRLLREYKEKYPSKIKINFHRENKHISASSNTCIQSIQGLVSRLEESLILEGSNN